MFCPSCGKEASETGNFCKYCGFNLTVFRKKALEPDTPVPTAAEPVAEEEPQAVAAEPVAEEEPQAVAAEPVIEEEPQAVAAEPVAEEEPQAVAAEPMIEEEPQAAATEPVAEEEPQTAIAESTKIPVLTEAPKKNSKKKWIIIGGIAVIVIVAVILIIIFSVREDNYKKAVELYESGRYSEAQTAFENLGNYKDSTSLASECANEILYINAESLMRKGDKESLSEAADEFAKIQEYKDSEELYTECIKNIAYIEGLDLFDSDEYVSALEVFIDLDGYKDSESYAEQCKKYIRYNEGLIEGKALMDAGKYEEASNIFYDVYMDTNDEAWELYKECRCELTYQQAVKDYNDGLYGTAYSEFTQISGYKDADEKAAACIQPLPATGEIYHNGAYTAYETQLTIDNGGFKNTYIKIYTAGGEHVCTLFLRENETLSVILPAGAYAMNQAYGDNWFGEKELFGKEGRYWKVKFGTEETFTLEYGYGYSISADNTGGTNIVDEETDPSNI